MANKCLVSWDEIEAAWSTAGLYAQGPWCQLEHEQIAACLLMGLVENDEWPDPIECAHKVRQSPIPDEAIDEILQGLQRPHWHWFPVGETLFYYEPVWDAIWARNESPITKAIASLIAPKAARKLEAMYSPEEIQEYIEPEHIAEVAIEEAYRM